MAPHIDRTEEVHRQRRGSATWKQQHQQRDRGGQSIGEGEGTGKRYTQYVETIRDCYRGTPSSTDWRTDSPRESGASPSNRVAVYGNHRPRSRRRRDSTIEIAICACLLDAELLVDLVGVLAVLDHVLADLHQALAVGAVDLLHLLLGLHDGVAQGVLLLLLLVEV